MCLETRKAWNGWFERFFFVSKGKYFAYSYVSEHSKQFFSDVFPIKGSLQLIKSAELRQEKARYEAFAK